jgi:pilus assembly protein CpaC
VRLQVRFVEIDRSKLNQFGVNFFSGGKNISNVTTGQFPVTTTITPSSFQISDPLNILFYNTDVNVGVVIKDLEDKQVLQILAEPNITTISGQKADFISGGEFPYPVVQGGGAGTAATVTIQFRPYGVKLDFTPVVNPDGTIQLKVAPEVSALDYTNAVTISGFVIPALSTRRAETQVELKNGQSFAISGLLDRRTTDSLGKVPGIGELPILGALFRSKNINHSTVELVVIVTPAVVDPLTDTTQPTQPNLPIPVLDPKTFDKKMVKSPEKSSGTVGPK